MNEGTEIKEERTESESKSDNETKHICSICHKEFSEDDLTHFDGEVMCPECLAVKTRICSHCGNRIWKDDNYGNSETVLCEYCYDEYYTECCDCGRIIHREDAYYFNDDDEPYCCSCYENHRGDHSIEDYCYKPEPIFYGSGNRYFGVELEVDNAGEDDDSAEKIMNIGNYSHDHIYCKHDGSLDEGFEIVIHPMTLDYHIKEMPWEKMLDKLRYMGYLSHRANTCGLHIHVNRNAFGNTEEMQDECIARILYFFEKHWEELLKFSRRTSRQLERWAARYGYKDKPSEILDHAKKGNGNGRYTCINLQNTNTIEFIMFRGTLKYNTVIATLQLVNRICDVALFMSDDELKNMSWTSFVSACNEPELIQYLKERRLYTNEPIESEDEL